MWAMEPSETINGLIQIISHATERNIAEELEY